MQNEVINEVDRKNVWLERKSNFNKMKLIYNEYNEHVDKWQERKMPTENNILLDAKEEWLMIEILKQLLLLKALRADERKVLKDETEINKDLTKNEFIKELSKEIKKNQDLTQEMKERIDKSLENEFKQDSLYNAFKAKASEFEGKSKDELADYISGKKEIFTADDFITKDITKFKERITNLSNEIREDIKNEVKEKLQDKMDGLKDIASKAATKTSQAMERTQDMVDKVASKIPGGDVIKGAVKQSLKRTLK